MFINDSLLQSCSNLFALRLWRVFFEVQENEREQEHAHHHGKRAHIVRIRAQDEPLILRVLQRSYRHLSSAVEMRVSDTIVIDFELVNSVDVGYFKSGFVLAGGFAFQRRANERVDAHKFQLNVFGSEWFPFPVLQRHDFYGVNLPKRPCYVNRAIGAKFK